MSETSIRQEIYDIVSAVSDVGRVYDYERLANDLSTFIDCFKAPSGDIRGWTITCAGWTQEYNRRVYVYKIRGYFGLYDSAASEKTALAIVDSVARALNASDVFDDNEVAQLDVFEPRMFGGTLCHYAELTFRVKESEVF